MNRKKQRGEVLRTNLLVRAEHAISEVAAQKLLIRCLTVWREPVWRGRKLIQKSLNVLSFRAAVAHARRRLLAVVYGAWADALSMEATVLKQLLATSRTHSSLPGVAGATVIDPESWPVNPARTLFADSQFHDKELPFFKPPPGLSLWQ
jgi:hypothetical protein